MILELGDGSSALARGAAALVLSLHVTAGVAGVGSGLVALVARKGSPLHRRAGHWFLASMLVMAAIGAATSPFLPEANWGNVTAGVFTIYLVATSWMAVRRDDGRVSRFDVGALAVALGVTLADAALGLRAAYAPPGTADGAPVPAYFIFAAVAALAATGDLRLIMRGGALGARRIARHLWRMCVALFIAAASFFLGQQQVLPASLRGSPLLFVPEILVLGLMIFWLVRVRRPGWLQRWPARRRLLGEAAPPGRVPGSV